MNGINNDDNRNRRPVQERMRQQNGPRPRQNVQQQPPQKRQQQQAAKPESPPASYVRKEAGAQHQPKCQDTAPLPPLKLDVVKHLWLDASFIMVLTKRAVQHPNAQFYCKLCNYYCMSFGHCEQHAKDAKHERNMNAEAKMTTISNLPPPTQSHFDAITSMLSKTYEKHGLEESEKQARVKFASQINALISDELPGCKVNVYGSSLTGIAVKKADLNLDFVVAKDVPAPEMLLKAFHILSASSLAIDVMSDFNNEIPSILFTDKAKVHNCVLSLNHHDASNTCKLIEMYAKMDPRVKVLGCCFRHWTKLCKIDDIQMAMLPSYSYSLLLIYFLQQVEPPVLPVVEKVEDGVPEWKSENTMSVGELWYRMLRFYALDFPEAKNVVCIRQVEPLSKNDKQWTSRKIAIEDPFLQKRNVSRYLVSATYDYIMLCFTNTYQYFAVPQTDIGPLIGTIRLPMDKYMDLPDVKLNIVRAEQGAIDAMDSDPKRFVKSSEGKKVYSVEELESGVDRMAVDERKLPYGHYASRVVTPRVAQAMCLRLKNDVYKFEFNPRFFGQDHPIVCNICLLEGHTRNNCPDIYLPPLQDLPQMNSRFLRELDSVCKQEMENWLPSDEEVHERKCFVQDLQHHLKRRYPTVNLNLFGSSCNGFGFRKSDLDICLTFTDKPTGEGVNDVALIEELGNELKTYEHLQNLLTITTAKVPIIKFTYPRIRVECDISLYNTLAQRNTLMLRFYTEIDPRVAILGFTLKRYAKLCDICDASRGSLSSYAYILMAIYFLQQCNPPVIPVLQELYEGDTQPQLLVETWNTWFYDDMDKLCDVWPEYGKNTTSVGELWYQMLRFYTEEFDYNKHVISIKQKEKLDRFQKLWTSKCIAIEDPFDLSHNLGSGLSRKMNNFIIKAFRKGRMHFGTPIKKEELIPPYKELREYLFDARYLTEGTVPNDRGCRICKKIGHLARNCPKSQQQQQKPKNQRPNRQQNQPQHQQNHQQQHQQLRREQSAPKMHQNAHPVQQQHHQQQPPFRQNMVQQGRPFQQQQQQQHHQQQQQHHHQQQQQQKHHQTQQQQHHQPQQVNGMTNPSPPLPLSPTKGHSAAPNSSPAFDNFMRLMQGRGATPMMQVPPGFASQLPPQQQQQQQQQSPQGHFFQPQAKQHQPHPQQQMYRQNGMQPQNQQFFFPQGAPVNHQMQWPGGMGPPQQQQQQTGPPMFQQQPQGMGLPPIGHPPQPMLPQQQQQQQQ